MLLLPLKMQNMYKTFKSLISIQFLSDGHSLLHFQIFGHVMPVQSKQQNKVTHAKMWDEKLNIRVL